MSLTTIVGALLALVARPQTAAKEDPRFIAGYDAGLNDGRLEAKEEKRERKIQREHIEWLQRELALTQEVLAHWRNEAARLARENRDRREQSSQTLYAQRHSALAREMIGQQQFSRQHGLQQAQQSAFGQQSVYQGFCNCVPSRSQVWGAQHGLVQQLNDNGRE